MLIFKEPDRGQCLGVVNVYVICIVLLKLHYVSYLLKLKLYCVVLLFLITKLKLYCVALFQNCPTITEMVIKVFLSFCDNPN
jgi:hypothetical protein